MHRMDIVRTHAELIAIGNIANVRTSLAEKRHGRSIKRRLEMLQHRARACGWVVTDANVGLDGCCPPFQTTFGCGARWRRRRGGGYISYDSIVWIEAPISEGARIRVGC